MKTEKNKIIIGKYFEMWNTGNVKIADEILSSNYVDFAHPEIKNVDEIKQSVVKTREIFSDFNIIINKMIADVNTVCVFGDISRTNKDKKESFKIIWLVTINEEKMTELWTGNVIYAK